MKSPLKKIGVVVTIALSFIEAAYGSPTGALVFWLTLFWAAVMSDDDTPRPGGHRRIM